MPKTTQDLLSTWKREHRLSRLKVAVVYFVILAFLCCLACLFAGHAEAATYYVATTGNDANDGSLGTPWKTPHKAELSTAAGDTVLFRGGTYRHSCCTTGANCPDPLGNAPDGIRLMYIQHGGTAGNPITYKAYPGETPVFEGRHWNNGDANGDGNEDGVWIDASGQTLCYGDGTANYTPLNGDGTMKTFGSTSNERLIEIKAGVSYVVLDGLTLTESNRYTVVFAEDPTHTVQPPDHITLQNMTLQYGWDTMVQIRGSNNTFTNNIERYSQHNTGFVFVPSDKSELVNNNTLTYNVAYRNGYRKDNRRVQPAAGDADGGGNSDGFQCYKDCGILAAQAGSADAEQNSLCRKNTLENNATWINADDGFDLSCTEMYVHNNISLSVGGGPDGWGNNGGGNGVCYKVFLTSPRPKLNVWVGNVGAFCEESGVELRDIGPVFLHNTMIYNGHSGSAFNDVSSLAIDGSVVANNIMAFNQNTGNKTEWLVSQISTGCTTCRNNLLLDASGVAVGGSNLTNTDPHFRNVAVFATAGSAWRHLNVPDVAGDARTKIRHIRQALLDGLCPASNSAALNAGVVQTWTIPQTGAAAWWSAKGQEDIGFCEVGVSNSGQ